MKTKRLKRIKKKEKGFTYAWQDMYCTDDHIKELSLIPPIQYKGTLDVTPLSSTLLYQVDLDTSESDDDSTSTTSTDTPERTSDSLFDTEKTATTAVTIDPFKLTAPSMSIT